MKTLTAHEVKKLEVGTEIKRNGKKARVVKCGPRKMLRVVKNGFPEIVAIKDDGAVYEEVGE